LAAPIAEYHGREDDRPGPLMIYGWGRPFSRDELPAFTRPADLDL